MGKLLGWVLVGVLVWFVWRFMVISKRRAERSKAAEPSVTDPTASRQGEHRDTPVTGKTPEMMMQCVVCGVHLPATEALFAGGNVYCCEAHRNQGPPAHAGAAAKRDES
jgi:uncharacterized protein